MITLDLRLHSKDDKAKIEARLTPDQSTQLDIRTVHIVEGMTGGGRTGIIIELIGPDGKKYFTNTTARTTTAKTIYQKWVDGDHGYTDPGEFADHLFSAYGVADGQNKAILRKAFPGYFTIQGEFVAHDAQGQALSKAQLYDLIGDANRVIVECEHKIPEMEDVLASLIGEPDNEMAVRQSLHEARILLDQKQAEVKNLRLTLIGRMEIELEGLEAELLDIHEATYKFNLKRELEKLKTLVYGGA